MVLDKLRKKFVFNFKLKKLKRVQGELNGSDGLTEQSIDETAEELEKKRIYVATSHELMGLVNGSVRVVDFSFNVLFGLRLKRINWRALEDCVQDFGEANLSFSVGDRSGLDVDFSKVFSAVNRQVARETAKEAYNVLSLVYGYFNGLNVNGDFDEPHPNFKDSKTLILGYYLLNDVLLGMIVGDKKISEEKEHLMKALQDLADKSVFMINSTELSDALDKLGSEYDFAEGIEYCRELLKEPLKQLEVQVNALQAGVIDESLSKELVGDKVEGEICSSSMVIQNK
jgi:hypothetical protein